MQKEVILHIIDAALEAGRCILDVYNDPQADFEIERKADNSPLTIADRKSNEVITRYLQETPYPILSEEGKHLPYKERCQWDAIWIVDPLDGTKEFIKRNGEFTVNIAWVKGHTPLFGVIYVPVKQTLYWGDVESGKAFKLAGISQRGSLTLNELEAQATRLPVEKNTEAYVIVASRSHLSPETEKRIQAQREIHQQVELVSVGSSIKICWVAEGVADEYPRYAPTMEWDTAAGHAIAKAAGAEIYQADTDTPVVYNKEDLLNPWFLVRR